MFFCFLKFGTEVVIAYTTSSSIKNVFVNYFYFYLTSSNGIFCLPGSLPYCPKMPRTYISKGVLQMDRTGLKKAFYYRVETGCSLKEAAEKYDVKIMTLQVSLWKTIFGDFSYPTFV